MADSSMPKVTITLGHNRQVVKKGEPGLDSSFGDSESIVGRKRSVKDRLGGKNDLTPHYENKRLRASDSTSSLSTSNDDIDDTGLSQDDLRFKILKKKTIHKKSNTISQQSGLDLRDMLSRPAQSSTTVSGPHKHTPKKKNFPEPRIPSQHLSQRVAEDKDSRQHTPERKQDLVDPTDRGPRDPRLRVTRQHTPEREAFVGPRDGGPYRDPRQHMSERKDVRHDFVDPRDPRRQHMPEGKDSINHFVDPREGNNHGRQSMSDPRDPRLREMSEIRDNRQQQMHMPEGKNVTHRFMFDPRDPRAHVSEGKDTGQRFMEPRDNISRQYSRYELSDPRLQMSESRNINIPQHINHMPEPCGSGIMGRIPNTSITGSSNQMEISKSPYNPWTLENLRQRSPDGGVIVTSRGFSPPRREEELQRRPSLRSYDDIRAGSYMSKDIEFSHPRPCASYMSMGGLTNGPAKMMGPPPPPLAPPMPLVQRSSYPVEDQFTVDSFLYSLGLGKYAINFKAEEVDVHALKQMGESDLKDLGIPMGPRKKILLALKNHATANINRHTF